MRLWLMQNTLVIGKSYSNHVQIVSELKKVIIYLKNAAFGLHFSYKT